MKIIYIFILYLCQSINLRLKIRQALLNNETNFLQDYDQEKSEDLNYLREFINGDLKQDVSEFLKQRLKKQDSKMNNWQSITKMHAPLDFKSGHTLIYFNDQLFIFGGCFTQCKNDLIVFDLKTQLWSIPQVIGAVPEPRSGHASVVVGQFLYIFGGWDSQLLDDFYKLDLVELKWQKIDSFGDVPTARANHQMVQISQSIALFGGLVEDNKYSNELYIFSYFDKRWTKIENSGQIPSPRESFSMAGVFNGIYIFGGFSNFESRNELFYYDFKLYRWFDLTLKEGMPAPRQSHQMIAQGDYLYIMGGCSTNYKLHLQNCYNDVFVYDIKKRNMFEQPSFKQARKRFSMTSSGKQLFIFGGQNGTNYFNDIQFTYLNDFCPNNCNNKGQCKNQRCECFDGFTGIDCSFVTKCPQNCNSRGVCDTYAKCKCFSGFSGEVCQKLIPCPFNCTGNGICLISKKCECYPQFTGEACNQKAGQKKKAIQSNNDDDANKQQVQQRQQSSCEYECIYGTCNEILGFCECNENYFGDDCSRTFSDLEPSVFDISKINISEIVKTNTTKYKFDINDLFKAPVDIVDKNYSEYIVTQYNRSVKIQKLEVITAEEAQNVTNKNATKKKKRRKMEQVQEVVQEVKNEALLDFQMIELSDLTKLDHCYNRYFQQYFDNQSYYNFYKDKLSPVVFDQIIYLERVFQYQQQQKVQFCSFQMNKKTACSYHGYRLEKTCFCQKGSRCEYRLDYMMENALTKAQIIKYIQIAIFLGLLCSTFYYLFLELQRYLKKKALEKQKKKK